MLATSDSRSQHFQVGTARVKITPAIGMPYLGYGWDRQDPFLGVNDDLWAKALVIDDGERVAALIACDMIGFPPAAFAAAVRAQVATHTAIPGEHVMLSASHTHSSHAPLTSPPSIWNGRGCKTSYKAWRGQRLPRGSGGSRHRSRCVPVKSMAFQKTGGWYGATAKCTAIGIEPHLLRWCGAAR